MMNQVQHWAAIATFAKEFRNTDLIKRIKLSARKLGEQLPKLLKAKILKKSSLTEDPLSIMEF